MVRKSASSIAESPPPTTHDLAVAEERAVAGGAVRDAAAVQRALGLEPELARARAGGDDHGLRAVLVVADPDPERALGEVDPRHVVGQELGAEALGLGAEVGHHLRAHDAVGVAGVVLDVARDHQLAAPVEALDHERLQVGARGVERGRVAGGAAADDDQLATSFTLSLLAPRSGVCALTIENESERARCSARPVRGKLRIGAATAERSRCDDDDRHLDALRELAAFRAENGCAISLYLDLDPRIVADRRRRGDARALAARLGREDARRDRADLAHEAAAALQGRPRADRALLGRASSTATARAGSRSSPRGSTTSGASCRCRRPCPTRCGSPTSSCSRRSCRCSAAATARSSPSSGASAARLLALRAGRLDEIADRTEEAPGRHDQGGWSQARYQRHIETSSTSTRDVAEEIDARFRRLRPAPVVVVAPEEMRARDRGRRSPAEARGGRRLGDRRGARRPTPSCSRSSSPLLERGARGRESEALERWREEAGRSGRAAAGWKETLEAASDGRVELLLYDEACEPRRVPLPARAAAPRSTRHVPARRHDAGAARRRPRPRGPPTLAHGGDRARRRQPPATSIPSRGSARSCASDRRPRPRRSRAAARAALDELGRLHAARLGGRARRAPAA